MTQEHYTKIKNGTHLQLNVRVLSELRISEAIRCRVPPFDPPEFDRRIGHVFPRVEKRQQPRIEQRYRVHHQPGEHLFPHFHSPN